MIFKIISIIGIGAPYFLSAIVIVSKNSERGRGFYHVLFISAFLFLMSFTKIMYGEPRMFWEKPQIKAGECTAEYGNPSGHTLNGIAYPMFLYLDLFENKNEQEKREHRMTKR